MECEGQESHDPESEFLHKLFAALNTSGVHYAVMRNYEPLPFSSGGSDLDIYVPAVEAKIAYQSLFMVVSGTNSKVIGVVRTWNFFEAYIIGYRNGQWWGICVEFYHGIVFKSTVELVDNSVLPDLFERHHGISVISQDAGNTIGYIKEILAHNRFREDKPQYKQSAAYLAGKNTDYFLKYFSPLGERSQMLLLKTLATAPQAVVTQQIKQFRCYVLISAFLKSPFKYLYRRLGHEFYRLSRYFRPPGSVIAILGVDGAGKSTVINAILPALNAATHNAVVVQHLRPTLLPPLARLKGKKHLSTGPVLEPHGSTPSGTVFSLLRLIYLTCDYLAGYWLWTRLRIAKQPTVVIFDRYAYDMALDQRRFRIRLPQRVVEWFVAMAPKPDLIFCLHGDPEILAARKGELPLEETRRQVNALREFARREPRAVLISTDTSIEETRDQVLQTLCTFLEKRAQERL
ncbi:MAG: Thymidylate kinase [Nitrosomonas europaea]|uniref:hypothetical protein n=1 Tax=Nitrosomonas europaea TaxID=915 RepID=UPI0023F26648|nr:hypothetical protein [Nitrosomonas europaea]MBV6389868.1 Thymidylate kinase [Nitrosomonas europaea]